MTPAGVRECLVVALQVELVGLSLPDGESTAFRMRGKTCQRESFREHFTRLALVNMARKRRWRCTLCAHSLRGSRRPPATLPEHGLPCACPAISLTDTRLATERGDFGAASPDIADS